MSIYDYLSQLINKYHSRYDIKIHVVHETSNIQIFNAIIGL